MIGYITKFNINYGYFVVMGSSASIYGNNNYFISDGYTTTSQYHDKIWDAKITDIFV